MKAEEPFGFMMLIATQMKNDESVEARRKGLGYENVNAGFTGVSDCTWVRM